MEKELRLEAFERMLAAVQVDYDSTTAKMRTLKEAGKEKTATYRQLMGHKLELQNVLPCTGFMDCWKTLRDLSDNAWTGHPGPERLFAESLHCPLL